MTETLPMLRTSERRNFKRCGARWKWSAVDGLVPIGFGKKPALEFGDLVHQSMAAYYIPGRKRGPHPAKTFQKLYEAHGDFSIREYQGEAEDVKKTDAGVLGVAILERYIEKYGHDSDIKIIAPEMPFKIRLVDAGGQPFWYVGRFDALGIWVPTDEPFIFEHKTAQSIRTTHLDMDEQASSYWAFAPEYIQTLLRKGLFNLKKKYGKSLLGLEMMLFNFLRKAVPNPEWVFDDQGRVLKKDGEPRKNQPPPYFDRVPVYRDEDDRQSVIQRICQEMYVMRLTRAGELPILKNPTKDCFWDCQFYDMCELHETKSDWKSFRNGLYEVGDPYLEYRRDLLEVAA